MMLRQAEYMRSIFLPFDNWFINFIAQDSNILRLDSMPKLTAFYVIIKKSSALIIGTFLNLFDLCGISAFLSIVTVPLFNELTEMILISFSYSSSITSLSVTTFNSTLGLSLLTITIRGSVNTQPCCPRTASNMTPRALAAKEQFHSEYFVAGVRKLEGKLKV